MDIFKREHEYQHKDKDLCDGMYERCIHCGETIGQGWYGTANDKCKPRLNISLIRKYCDFTNLTIVNIYAKDDEIFCVRPYSELCYTKKEFLDKLKTL